MAQSRQYALLQFPGINVTSLQHVAAVIRLNNDRRAATQPLANKRGDVAKIHQRCNLHALVSGRKSKVIDRVMWNCEWVKIDFPDAKVSTGLNRFDTIAQGPGTLLW